MNETKPSSGPRRKRWIFGSAALLAVVLFFPFLVPDPRPPCRFLEKARLRYIQTGTDDGDRVAYASYMVAGDFASVFRAAKAELQGWSIQVPKLSDSLEFHKGKEVITIVKWNFGDEKTPLTHVLYDHPARWIDEIRAPIHKVKSWLP